MTSVSAIPSRISRRPRRAGGPARPRGRRRRPRPRRRCPRPARRRGTRSRPRRTRRPRTSRAASSVRHRPLDGLELLGREGDGRPSAVELLHVDARVVAALDRAHDDAGPRRVQERERRRRLAGLVVVGVVAKDRRLRDAVVDPAVDARERAGDLVDRAVEVVDPRLQRDGEVDEIRLAAAEQDELRRDGRGGASATRRRRSRASERDERRAGGDPRRGRAGQVHPRLG